MKTISRLFRMNRTDDQDIRQAAGSAVQAVTREDRIKGVLVGQAAGDALGANYEFGLPVPVADVTWDKRGGWKTGEWTDDTEQAIIVALFRSDPVAVGAGLMHWYSGSPKDVGIWTRRVMSAAGQYKNTVTVNPLAEAARKVAAEDAKLPKRAGMDPGLANGSLMRTGPAALPFLGDRDRIAQAARDISDLTHADPYTGDACVIWSLAIDRAVELGAGMDLGKELRSVVGEYIPAERQEFWVEVITWGVDGPDRSGQRNGGVIGAFKAALYAVSHADDFESTVKLAVSFGRDTDTVAAIAGALAGAMYGASAVPAEWRAELYGWPGLNISDLEQLALDTASGTAGSYWRAWSATYTG
jgi:ADP-ribosylglycohydrolase